MKTNNLIVNDNGVPRELKKRREKFRLNRKVFSYPYMLFLLVFVVLPLVMILVNAFWWTVNFPWVTSWTFHSKDFFAGIGQQFVGGIGYHPAMLDNRLSRCAYPLKMDSGKFSFCFSYCQCGLTFL